MVPPSEALPDVLPTRRLLAGGKPAPPLRDELRRIAGPRNAVTVVGCWLQAVTVVVAAAWIARPAAYAAAVVLMGRAVVMFSILAHEGAHRTLFRSRRVNDWVGAWLLAYPAFVPMAGYRRGHIEVLDRSGLETRACECYAVVRKELARLLSDVQRRQEVPAAA